MSKRILIINTGGTLSSVMKKNGLIPGLSIYDMQKELKMVSGDTDIEIEDFCSLDSANIFRMTGRRLRSASANAGMTMTE